jgi:hypothetical protein
MVKKSLALTPPLPYHQYRAIAVLHDSGRDAAQKKPRDRAQAFRAGDDQIRFLLRRDLQHFIGRFPEAYHTVHHIPGFNQLFPLPSAPDN